MNEPANPVVVRVQITSLEDTRRVIFSCLASVVPAKEQARQARLITAKLRDARLLCTSLEQHYSAAQVGALCGGRSSAWAVKHARLGDFGPVACDGGHWLIPASGVQDYLSRFGVASPKRVAPLGGFWGEKFSKRRGRPGRTEPDRPEADPGGSGGPGSSR